jgi:hypothetical protein
MTDKAWKRFERRVADFIKGERVPITGRARGSAPDVEHNWLAVECKYRQSIPEWLKDAMRQAVASAMPRQMPVVILGEKGKDINDAFFIVRARDFKDHWL